MTFSSDVPVKRGFVDPPEYEELSPSFRSFLVELTWHGQSLAFATAFAVRLEDRLYLVSSRHNISGRHGYTNAIMHQRGVTPDAVRIKALTSRDPLDWDWFELPLLDEDERPLWFEHPVLAGKADIAVLPIDPIPGAELLAYDIDPPAIEGDEPMYRVGDDLFAVGFPLGRSSYGGIPIWLRASVASEPSVPYEDQPVFLVDARTTTGMSGCPVVLRRPLNATLKATNGSTLAVRADDIWVLGVYSGRIGGNLNVGRVWKFSAIMDTIMSRYSFPSSGDRTPIWRNDR